ncbi:MAG TPA: HYR domain-containing protein, partial [Bacteroidia bacterium]|nr:HYR domain-containing protein [Bacteroidia bacterium]
GVVATPSSPTSSFSGVAGTSYTLRWTITNAPCAASTDDVVIGIAPVPTTANAGPDQTICGPNTTMAGNTPSVGTGAWTVIAGAGGSFGTPTSPTSSFTGVPGTTYTLRWTISLAPCTSNSDNVLVTLVPDPTTANAGLDQSLCGSTTTLAGNNPSIGTGSWSIVAGAGGTVTTPSSPTSGFTGVLGSTYTLRWTVANAPCPSSTDDMLITPDVIAPTITCPANVTVTNAPGQCSANVTYSAPVVTDNCTSPTTTQIQGLASGASFPIGITGNTYRSTDATGNSGTCSFVVTVVDNEAPTAACQAATVTLDPNGNAILSPTAVDNGSTDNCSGLTFSLSQFAFTCADAGTNTVSLTAIDNAGNTATCSATVTVIGPAVTASIQSNPNACGFDIACAGGNDGSATAMGAGGCSNFTYLWSNGDVNATATGLTAGTYTVTITDGSGRTDVASVTLTAPTAIVVSSTTTSSCQEDSTGSIDLTVSGGSSCLGYAYDWSDGQSVEDPTNLTPGVYTVTISDAGGCEEIQTITLAPLPAPNPAIVRNGNTLSSVLTWSSYQWRRNSVDIIGA